MPNKEKPKRKISIVKTILYSIGILFCSICIYGFIMIFILPSIPRPKQFCSEAEFDAQTIVATISDYFSDPEHTDVTPDQLKAYEPLLENIENPWTFAYTDGELIVQLQK
jgi:hypothetical protein